MAGIPLTLPHAGLVLDACCAINIYAAGYTSRILSALPVSVAVASYVKEHEIKRIYSGPVAGVPQPDEEIDLAPLIEAGQLHVLDAATEAEQNAYVMNHSH